MLSQQPVIYLNSPRGLRNVVAAIARDDLIELVAAIHVISPPRRMS